MRNAKSQITLTLLFMLIILFLGKGFVSAKENATLFLSENCGYCAILVQSIEENDLDKKVSIDYHFISDEPSNKKYLDASAKCGFTQTGTPLLVVDGECYIGSTNAEEKLFAMAGLDQTVSGETDSNETQDIDDSESTEYEKDNESTGDVSTDNDEIDNSTGIGFVDFFQNESTPWKPTLLDWVFIILAPITFLGVGYILINKLDL